MIRRFAAIIATLALLTAGPGAAPSNAAGPDLKFTSSGEFASVSWWSTSGDNGWVYVTRSDTREIGTYTFISYHVQRSGAIESGYGTIPSTAFTGRAATSLSLEIDTSTSLGPYFYRTNGAGGPIALRWDRTNATRSSWSGHQEFTYTTPWGAVTYRLIGSRQSFSAAASGLVFGTAPSGTNTWAEVGKNHQVQFTYFSQ